MVEWLGTAASVVVAISLMQKNLKRLRLISLIGSAAFAGYGALIQAWPVLGLNSFIVVVNIWFLYTLRNTDERFSFYEVDLEAGRYIKIFLNHYGDDIRTFFPNFDGRFPENSRAILVLRDALPVSLVVWRPAVDRNLEILLDYAVPRFRDYRNARFFFDYAVRHMDSVDAEAFIAYGGEKRHESYLRKMNFQAVLDDSGNTVFRRSIKQKSPPIKSHG